MIDIVMTAKRMGIYVLVADREVSSPAKKFADKALRISTDNIVELAAVCREEGVNGVFTGFEDFNIHIARELCDRLNLPFYATREQLALVTNKLRFKEECRRYNVPVIEQYSLLSAAEEGKYPYIVKPSDSYGSRGITVCRTRSELEQGYKIACKVSTSGTAIIERFIDSNHGTELFYTVINGNIHLTATADRYTAKSGGTAVPLPVAEVFPSRHQGEMIDLLDKNIRRMLIGLGIRNGLVLIQALYDGKDYFAYEMAYRFTGEQHYLLVEKQHGVALGEMMISLALGEDVSKFDTALLDADAFCYPAVNLAILLRPGIIGTIQGVEKICEGDEVVSYILTHAENDEIKPAGNYSHVLMRVNMVAHNYERLCQAVERVNHEIKVISDIGVDMLVTRFQLPHDV